ncbi:PREDICTED: calcium-independent phospholipase A2-gamma-like isoform X1 [Trachymyrmex cornetzi]|uniref:calcium-independent phospholipase A2-gamma-like isoform X1 n=2 Tax=Trachymyrmex cornetzi TaxID=471704 RepID=UPI00084F7389|nr:PREDICTED: calcium-independent phospholipase A2-gamma-like isoform X1 [Trachymyrmex cornetzi]
MAFNRHAKHCQKCVLLTRQLTDSATGKDAGGNVTSIADRFLRSVSDLKKAKMSMQNQWKLLSQLKDYLNKANYDKNQQIIVSKDWLDSLQKLTYSQLETIRKLSSGSVSTATSKISNTKHKDSNDLDNVKLMPEQTESLADPDSTNVQRKTQQQIREQGTPDNKIESKDGITMPQILSTLLFKLSPKATQSSVVTPKWKVNIHSNIPKHSIVSRTRHVLNSIISAESNASKLRRLEELLLHVDQYPEARHYAIKEGAIRILLQTRQKAKDEQIKASIREALAVMGYIDPLPGRGIRILSIDGGGIRGVLVIEMLKKLEELTGKKTYEMFDYICGVSTGAILAAVLVLPKDILEGGHKRKSLDEVSALYKDLSTKVFTQSAIKGTSSLVWSHAYYDTALWEKLLTEHLGDKILIKTTRDPNAPKFAAISAVVNHERVMAYVFRNYTLPHRVESQYMGSHKYKLWEAVRASAAAPSYFEEFKYGDYLHQDGGILVNNPCAVAIHEAKQLWPNNPIQCVVSFGTGRIPHHISGNESLEVAISSWKEKFYKILDSATDTEAVHTMLNDLLPDHIYFRFNPYLTEMLSMVEIRPDKISQMEQDARMYVRRNEEKFQMAATALLEKRQIQQKVVDWIILQRQLSSL